MSLLRRLHLYLLLSHWGLVLWLGLGGLWWHDYVSSLVALVLLLPAFALNQGQTYGISWACFLYLYYIAAGLSGFAASSISRLALGEFVLAFSALCFGCCYVRVAKAQQAAGT